MRLRSRLLLLPISVFCDFVLLLLDFFLSVFLLLTTITIFLLPLSLHAFFRGTLRHLSPPLLSPLFFQSQYMFSVGPDRKDTQIPIELLDWIVEDSLDLIIRLGILFRSLGRGTLRRWVQDKRQSFLHSPILSAIMLHQLISGLGLLRCHDG